MTEKERGLWVRYGNGDEGAFEELILFYLPQVQFWARKLSQKAAWAHPKDLEQEGIIGLIKAIKGFDPDKGYEFSTYARYDIRGEMVKSPEYRRIFNSYQQKQYSLVKNIQDGLIKRLGRKPTPEEIAREVKLSVEQVNDIIELMSLAPIEEPDDSEMHFPDTNDTIKNQEDVILIEKLLSSLDDREATIVDMHYFLDMPYKEIARRLNLEEANARQIVKRAFIRLQTQFDKKEGE